MDPISSALIAAAVAGITATGPQVVKDAYAALKSALQRKFGDESNVVQAVETVEKEPDFKPNQDALVGRVEQAKAVEDEELKKLAQTLIEALKTTEEGQAAVSKHIVVKDSQVGVIGDDAKIEGGISFGDKPKSQS